MASVIQNMIEKTIGDGARSTKFDCVLLIKDLSENTIPDPELVFHIKTSRFPGKSIDVIDFKYKGRNIPIKGQVKYDNTWSCTFYLTEDHKLKNKFENWIESLEQVHNMSSELSKSVKDLQQKYRTEKYSTEMSIIQYDFDGTTEKARYILHNVFPKSVSAVDVDYSAVGSILEYTVEFSYSHYTFKDGAVSENKTKADALKEKGTEFIKEKTNDFKDALSSATSSFLKTEGGFSKKVSDSIQAFRDEFE